MTSKFKFCEQTNRTIICTCGKEASFNEFKSIQKDLPQWEINSNCIPITKESISLVRCPECKAAEKNRLWHSENMIDRIQGGYYNDYPEKFKPDVCKKFLTSTYLSHHNFSEESQSAIFAKAWDEAHSSGFLEVYYKLQELTELIEKVMKYEKITK